MSDESIDIPSIDCRSAEEFINELRRSNARWLDNPDHTKGLEVPWVFRGQWNSRWPLLPKAYRPEERKDHKKSLLGRKVKQIEESYLPTKFSELEEVVNPSSTLVRLPDVSSGVWNDRLKTATIDCAAHSSLIRDFALLAEGAGHSIHAPDYLQHLFHKADSNKTSCMSRFFNGKELDFTGSNLDDSKGKPLLDPIFAIAQHHGVPTGLMDWSRSPLISAYFAAERIISNGPTAGERIAVFALHISALNNLNQLVEFSIRPGTETFLDAQKGLFTWSPAAYHMFVTNGAYLTINEIVNQLEHAVKPAMCKITLPQSEARAVLKILWREHITLAHLMPTFDNVYQTMIVQSEWYKN